MRHVPLALLVALALPAAAQDTPDFALTIYSSAQPGQLDSERLAHAGPDLPGYAVVRDRRRLELQRGRTEVRFPYVAARMDPSTVTFESLTDPDGTRVLEQNYQFDLVGRERLLERYIGESLTVEQARGDALERTTGELLSAEGGLTLRLGTGELATLTEWTAIRFPALPGGLMTRPTLLWLVEAERGGSHDVRVSYQARGLTWWADYNGVLDTGAGCALDLGAWVTLVNRSGASFPDTRLKLVAGDVQRVEPPPSPVMYARAEMAADARGTGFRESALFEYHLYTLDRRTDLPDRSTKQLELFPAASAVPCTRQLVFTAIPPRPLYGSAPALDGGFAGTTEGSVAAWLEFDNRERHGLGIPLPAGRLRVSQRDADGSLEFIGEDVIDHTPRNETLRVRLGSAFDVVGERRQVAWQVDGKGRWAEETVNIEIRNRKQEPVEVVVRDYLYRWSGWAITRASHDHQKRDALTVDFPVSVPPDGSVTVDYTVRYTW